MVFQSAYMFFITEIKLMLKVATCQNQDPLEATTGLVPLLGIDVWEHAYYLQYKNLRGSYVESIFNGEI